MRSCISPIASLGPQVRMCRSKFLRRSSANSRLDHRPAGQHCSRPVGGVVPTQFVKERHDRRTLVLINILSNYQSLI
jgi:hypothetical protein